MAKIVINRCFGGFGISDTAIRRYGEIKGINLVQVPGEFLSHWYINGVEDDEHYFSTYDIERDDPALVQVVEELGSDANDRFAELEVVEIDPGTRYRIDEYDGRESVMTVDDYDWKIAQ